MLENEHQNFNGSLFSRSGSEGFSPFSAEPTCTEWNELSCRDEGEPSESATRVYPNGDEFIKQALQVEKELHAGRLDSAIEIIQTMARETKGDGRSHYAYQRSALGYLLAHGNLSEAATLARSFSANPSSAIPMVHLDWGKWVEVLDTKSEMNLTEPLGIVDYPTVQGGVEWEFLRLRRLGRLSPGEAIIRRLFALGSLVQENSVLQGSIAFEIGVQHFLMNQGCEAVRWWRKAARLAQKAGNTLLLCICHLNLALALSGLGEHARAKHHLKRARMKSKGFAVPRLKRQTWLVRAILALHNYPLEETETLLRRLRKHLSPNKYPEEIQMVELLMAEIATLKEEWEVAERCLGRSREAGMPLWLKRRWCWLDLLLSLRAYHLRTAKNFLNRYARLADYGRPGGKGLVELASVTYDFVKTGGLPQNWQKELSCQFSEAQSDSDLKHKLLLWYSTAKNLGMVDGYPEGWPLVTVDGHVNEVTPKDREDFQRVTKNRRNVNGTGSWSRRLLNEVQRYAEIDVPVLILGETGTGKETLAHALHERSPRASQPFIAVNCAAFADTLLESELFGYVKGAFTGALEDHAGLFEAAGKGTIFLDEISELPPKQQAKLLRVIQERRVRRLGDTRERMIHCRFLFASNRNLEPMVEHGEFRADLYYRISMFPLRLPPLRERFQELPEIVMALLEKHRPRLQVKVMRVHPEVFRMLQEYSWPGNIRELEGVIQRALLEAGQEKTLRAKHFVGFFAEMRQSAGAWMRVCDSALEPWNSVEIRFPLNLTLKDAKNRFLAKYLEHILKKMEGNHTLAAKRLGVSRSTLYGYLKKYGISR